MWFSDELSKKIHFGDNMQLGDYRVFTENRRDENRLIDFLKLNNFKYCKYFENNPLNNEFVIVVNTIHRTYFEIDKYYLFGNWLSVGEFLENINYYENGHVIRKKLFSDKKLIYDGYTVDDKPYGLGTLYFDDGNKYKEGVFDVKGLAEGKEFYPNGQVKFEGVWSVTTGYGPNAPRRGCLFSENGDLIFSGEFEIVRCGVGAPMIRYPRYGRDPENRPKIENIHISDLKKYGMKSKFEKVNEWHLK